MFISGREEKLIKRKRMNLCSQIPTDPFYHHLANFSACVQDEGVAKPFLTQSQISTGEVPFDVVIILYGAPMVRGSIIKYKLQMEDMFLKLVYNNLIHLI